MDGLLSDKERLAFVNSVVKKDGCLYCWPTEENGYSGKGRANSLYRDVYDCSGLVTSSLNEATEGREDHRDTWNAQKLLNNCAVVTDPRPGDLAFYGPSRSLVTHVMVYIGTNAGPGLRGKRVFGASGGDSRVVTPEIAKERNAVVRGFKSHLYRHDFLCFGRLVSNDK